MTYNSDGEQFQPGETYYFADYRMTFGNGLDEETYTVETGFRVFRTAAAAERFARTMRSRGYCVYIGKDVVR